EFHERGPIHRRFGHRLHVSGHRVADHPAQFWKQAADLARRETLTLRSHAKQLDGIGKSWRVDGLQIINRHRRFSRTRHVFSSFKLARLLGASPAAPKTQSQIPRSDCKQSGPVLSRSRAQGRSSQVGCRIEWEEPYHSGIKSAPKLRSEAPVPLGRITG